MMNKEQLIDGIIDACVEIFEMMLPMSLTEKMSQRPLPFELLAPNPNDDIVASIGLTGENSGTISLSVEPGLALKMAGWMMECEYSELNSEVFEAVGEIINMIAGGLKNRLSSNETEFFNMSIPIVISGKDKHIFHGRDKECVVVPIETNHGLLYVTLVLDH